MRRVLLVGLDPAMVDFSDPALPPGMTAEKIHAGIKIALAASRGEQVPANLDTGANIITKANLSSARSQELLNPKIN